MRVVVAVVMVKQGGEGGSRMNEVMLRSEDGKVSLIGMIEMIDDA